MNGHARDRERVPSGAQDAHGTVLGAELGAAARACGVA